MKVYDCFLYSYNPDILEIRLNVLNDVVDKFIIVESPYNWHGMFKGLSFAHPENLKRFEKFLHKIEYVSVFDMPKYEHLESDGPEDAALRLETFNRDAIIRGLNAVDDNDIVIISDFDEIPKPEIIKNIKASGQGSISALTCLYFKFKLNSLMLGVEKWWTNSVIVPGKLVKNNSISKIRWETRNAIVAGSTVYEDTNIELITSAGWHFSWVGDAAFINEKLDGYRHNEFRDESGRRELVEELEAKDRDFAANDTINVPIDSFFPQYLVENKDKYDQLISKVISGQNVGDLQDRIYINP